MSVLDRFSLSGMTALVTGGAGLFGRQITAALAEAGARTFIAARNLEALESMAIDCRARSLDVTALQYDQGEEASILALRDKLLQRSGRIDVLVNNAVLRPMKQGYTDSAAAFDESMRVNATGLFAITRAFGDEMAKARAGSIINVGSIQGLVGPDAALYQDTGVDGWYPDYFFHKGGMVNYTRFVASYYGAYGIRCNGICPGGFRTDETPEPFVRRYSERTFLGRMADDTDLMGIIVFLASSASLYVTGANIPVDGGYTAH
jgi:NAD(P)-dependent dehydrogenase (short-subunit alcohol dehydrogenase family)